MHCSLADRAFNLGVAMATNVAESAFSLRGKSVKVPKWLQQDVENWIKHPHIESVLLFGSRVTGHATSVSDWDVAVLYNGHRVPTLLPCSNRTKHHVDFAMLSVTRLQKESHLIGTLAHELVQHGKLLAGWLPSINGNDIAMSEDALERHLEYGFKDLARAIREIVSAWEYSGYIEPIEDVVAGDASSCSDNGAEHVAKAFCVYLGITYQYTHDVRVLAQTVPAEWRSKVLAMDGYTSTAHVSRYTGDEETIGEVSVRIHRSMELLLEILRPCLGKLSQESIEALSGKLDVSLDIRDLDNMVDGEQQHSLVAQLATVLHGLRLELASHGS